MILILCGPVASGKTTFLKNWASKRDDVCGLLSPVCPDLGRVFVDLATGHVFPMETQDPTDEALLIGKYRFSLEAFRRAEETLKQAMLSSSNWLIIDEIGPLELKGKGLDQTTHYILKNAEPQKNVVLVVRENLIDKVIAHYGLHRDGVVISWPTKAKRQETKRSNQKKM